MRFERISETIHHIPRPPLTPLSITESLTMPPLVQLSTEDAVLHSPVVLFAEAENWNDLISGF